MPFLKQENGVGRLIGDLHISDVEELRNGLLDWLHDPSATALELAEVERCDTASLQLLCSLNQSAQHMGKQCRISVLPPAILEISGILGFSMIKEDVAPHEVAE
jgi:anti-anti-sigma regulatory factor